VRARLPILIAAAIALTLAALAWDVALPPRHNSLDALPATVWVLTCATVLFGALGLPLTRLLLPAPLRAQEWLWVLPVGACAAGLGLMLLGFAGLPMVVSVPLGLLAGIVFSVREVRSQGWPQPPSGEVLWVVYLGAVVFALAVLPMLLKLHYVSVTGTGSDAHMAAGTAHFLQHAYPLSTDPEQPIDGMPALWRSKFPIYYAFGGVAQLSGMESWEVMVPLMGLLLAMTAAGLFLVARHLLGASSGFALAAAGLAGVDRMALHTTLNPYFNQLWGYLTVPFCLVLSWWLFRPGEPRADRWRAAILLAIFSAILIFAYPLAAPVALLPLAVFFVLDRRERKARGERVPRLRAVYRGKRDLFWIIPLFLLLGQPLRGVREKFVGATKVLSDPETQLIQWAGDLQQFFPAEFFYSLPDTGGGRLLMTAIIVIAVSTLLRLPRKLGWGLGSVVAFGLLFAGYFSQYEYGFYFHFKVLAFVAPLILLIAVAGSQRWRRAGPALVAILAVLAVASLRDELDETGLQLGKPTIELADWAAELPQDASVRLDMFPPAQLWGAYFLHERRVCSQTPLLETDYPHVVRSRKADFIVVTRDRGRPADAVGRPLRVNEGYELYRMNPAVPGTDRCSQRQESRIEED
jgi:hypothetical protein